MKISFKFKYWGTGFNKKGKLFEMIVPLKCTEFVSYVANFADGNDREGPFFRLHDKILLLK